MYRLSIILFLSLFLFKCTAPSDQKGTYTPPGMDKRTELRYQQYLIEGKKLYKTYCTNCHGKEGKGVGKLYPPLANSDYLRKYPNKIACIIKYGQKGEIVVNGVPYNMQMPENKDLTPIKIAEILTYISNSWGNEQGFIPVSKVKEQLKDCTP